MQMLTWMKAQNRLRMSASDHAAIVELTIKVGSLQEAESYFENILDSATQKAACLPLLHAYVQERETEKAEVLMLKLQGLGLIVDAHPFNEMMKLYMSTGQLKKVPLMIQQMKQNMITLNVLSYNLWLRACGELAGAVSAEMVYEEMLNNKKIEVGWSTYATLANIYSRAGFVGKAIEALRTAELKLSTCKHLGYFFLMTLYANLNNKDGVYRLWEASKRVGAKITCAHYICVLSCLVKIGDFCEAERVFRSWEDACGRYDIRISNVLLGAYVRNGWIEKAESLHLRTLEKGGRPNYKTWEILMEGWIKAKKMGKAISAMKSGFSMLKQCHWRPSSEIVLAIAEYFNEAGHLKDAKKYIKVLHRLGLTSLALYKAVLKMHIQARNPALDILKMMEKDQVHLDEEASALIRCLNQIKGGED
ncbi:hypothetical protein Syun_004319 [Stephania yunnanensis]|uniref:Pentatricopeptide repeat-containing protein n=1 Tax=Stephania yunnanensis TaxID=152371 RepID=A0AAP0Q0N8_9MAGN